MDGRLINIGFGNTVISHRVVAVVAPGSAPMKRLRERATQADRLIDATHGRKTRSIIVTDSNHVILSAVHAETISQRMNGHGAAARPDPGEQDG
jgi:extracellular matrix regulatory protein A